jgi:hypothetical protein
MLNCYVIQARNRHQLRKKAMELGRTEESHFCSAGDKSCTFIGLYDVYRIEGSLRTGAILGHSSYWSHKTQAAAERHISTDRQLLTTVEINQKSTPPREYLFRAIYLLSSASIPKEERRTIEAWLLINGSNGKQQVEFAKEIARKRTTKRRLLTISSDIATPTDLHFFGFAEMREVFDPPIRVGRCFLSDVKRFNSLSRIRALMKKDDKTVFD